MRIAFAQLVLEAVVVSTARHQLQIYLGELLAQPVQARLAAHAGAGGIEVDHQRLPGLFIQAAGITRFGEQFPGLADGFAFGCAIHPVIHRVVYAGLAFAIAEDARRDG